MFTKPIDEITFEDVQSFCEERGEGVRVEYKSELNVKNHIPKIVSSFANTYGGIFLVGIKTDKTTNMPILPIEGIPNRRHIEESIQQSAEMSINPPVRPEVKIVNVGDGDNVVVVVRVAEGSLLAPHAIEDSTKVYFRVGSVTHPYELELANMELIAHMFKRREDSQVVARQILKQIEEKISAIEPAHITIDSRQQIYGELPKITVIAQPTFPYRPVISVSDIYELGRKRLSPLRRVAGGAACVGQRYERGRGLDDITKGYIELNEYGIIYHKAMVSIYNNSGHERIDCYQFFAHIKELIEYAVDLYGKCEYLGNIKISIHLQEVLDRALSDPDGRSYREEITRNFNAEPKCFDTEVFASIECLARDLENEDKRNAIVEELMCPLFWAFNIPVDNPNVREKVAKRIVREFHRKTA